MLSGVNSLFVVVDMFVVVESVSVSFVLSLLGSSVVGGAAGVVSFSMVGVITFSVMGVVSVSVVSGAGGVVTDDSHCR